MPRNHYGTKILVVLAKSAVAVQAAWDCDEVRRAGRRKDILWRNMINAVGIRLPAVNADGCDFFSRCHDTRDQCFSHLSRRFLENGKNAFSSTKQGINRGFSSYGPLPCSASEADTLSS